MALVLADRVRDTTTTTGTGTVTLSGTAPTGYQNFSVIGNGNTTYYTINAGSQWEVGIGTYSSAGPTLARTTVLSSSNGGALVNFSAGTKDVFVTYPSGEAVYQDGADIKAGTAILGVANGGTGAASLTSSYVLKGNGTSAVSSSIIYDNGTNVGIGTASPAQKLDVNGDAQINNLRVGRGAGNSVNSAVLGYQALNSNTSGGFNAALGYQTLFSNTTGQFNTACGFQTLWSNTTGTANNGYGNSALFATTTGSFNTANGNSALRANTTGSYNTALGRDALRFSSVGNNNTAAGAGALQQATTSDNTSIGYFAGYDQTSGSRNTYIGANTGRGIVTGSNNTIIGANVTGLAAGLSNTVIIADSAGNIRQYIDSSGNVGVGDTAPAYKLTVAGDMRLTGGGDLRLSSATGTTTAGGDSQIYNDANDLIFTTGTTTAERFRIGSVGQFGLSGANYGSSGQVLASQGSGAAPTWISMGVRSNGQNVISGSTTLGSADKGTNILILTSGITITFPASGYASGEGVAISNVSGGSVTLSAPGGSDFGTTLPADGSFFAFCDGGGFWRQYCYSTSRL